MSGAGGHGVRGLDDDAGRVVLAGAGLLARDDEALARLAPDADEGQGMSAGAGSGAPAPG